MNSGVLVAIASHSCGGTKELSAELGVAYNTVLAWKNGTTVPGKMAIKCLCAETKGVVHPYEVEEYRDLLVASESVLVERMLSFGFSASVIEDAFSISGEEILDSGSIEVMYRECLNAMARKTILTTHAKCSNADEVSGIEGIAVRIVEASSL